MDSRQVARAQDARIERIVAMRGGGSAPCRWRLLLLLPGCEGGTNERIASPPRKPQSGTAEVVSGELACCAVVQAVPKKVPFLFHMPCTTAQLGKHPEIMQNGVMVQGKVKKKGMCVTLCLIHVMASRDITEYDDTPRVRYHTSRDASWKNP